MNFTMKFFTLVALAAQLLVLVPRTCAAAAPGIQWQKTFGGSDDDYLWGVQQTTDGGYVLGGRSLSGVSGNKTTPNYGGYDYWVIKVDPEGNKTWEKSFGGSANDELRSLQQTSDGGYILGGESQSMPSGTKTSTFYGGSDYWIIKLDASGEKVWERSFGGDTWDSFASLQQTSDGGFILGGTSASGPSGNKTSPLSGIDDYWVVRLDADGNKIWDRSFGGSSDDQLFVVRQTTGDGYILGGYSYRRGTYRFWVVKLNADGSQIWDKDFGSGTGPLQSLQQTSDGGYILGGTANADYWVVKVDAAGNEAWNRYFGGIDEESLQSIQQTTDGGYILGGWSTSDASGNKTTANCNYGGQQDYWVVKIASNGDKVWEKSVGGVSGDVLFGCQQTSDGGYILGGASYSGVSCNKTTSNFGQNDFWLVKLGAAPSILTQPQSRTNNVGDSVTFSVVADGASPLNFQWLFNGTSIAGATGPTLTLTNTTHAQAGFYSVVVSNAYGSITSRAVRLIFNFLTVNMYAGLTIDGDVGQMYQVQYVPAFGNQFNWQTLTNVTLTNAPYLFIDVDSARVPGRFYRALPLP